MTDQVMGDHVEHFVSFEFDDFKIRWNLLDLGIKGQTIIVYDSNLGFREPSTVNKTREKSVSILLRLFQEKCTRDKFNVQFEPDLDHIRQIRLQAVVYMHCLHWNLFGSLRY